MVDWLWSLNLAQVVLFFVLLNALILVGAIAAEKIAARLFAAAPPAKPLRVQAWLLAISTVLINSAISVAGWLAWKSGFLLLNLNATPFEIVRDTLVLVLTMDFALYILHRIAHARWFYSWAHYLHHEYREVRMLTLFVMHPLEALGFGSLWVVTLTLFSFSVEAVVVFLQLNLWFGLAAHCGFSPYPAWLSKVLPALSVSPPAFHFEHHRNETVNFGFYTTIWDKLSKTSL